MATSLYARWKRKYLNEGINGLMDKHKKSDPARQALEFNNERLWSIIAKQAPESEVKAGLLQNLLSDRRQDECYKSVSASYD